MFTKSKSEVLLDEEINRQLIKLKTITDPDEYRKAMDTVERLQKTKIAETRSSPRVTPDTVVMAITNILGIAMIIRHENLNVITSKAMSFVPKTR